MQCTSVCAMGGTQKVEIANLFHRELFLQAHPPRHQRLVFTSVPVTIQPSDEAEAALMRINSPRNKSDQRRCLLDWITVWQVSLQYISVEKIPKKTYVPLFLGGDVVFFGRAIIATFSLAKIFSATPISFKTRCSPLESSVKVNADGSPSFLYTSASGGT